MLLRPVKVLPDLLGALREAAVLLPDKFLKQNMLGEWDSKHFGPMGLLFINSCREHLPACVVFFFFFSARGHTYMATHTHAYP